MKLTDPCAYAVRHVVENMRAADREEIFGLMPSDDEAAFIDEVMGYQPFRFCVWRDQPVAIFGATQTLPGVYTAFMFATDEFSSVGGQVTKFIKRDLIPAIENLGAHRCQAISAASHWWAHRWLRALGAVEECTLRRYGRNRQDYKVFRWDNRGHV